MTNMLAEKPSPKCFWYHAHCPHTYCPYENLLSQCTKKGNCKSKETQRAMKERLARNDR